MVSEREVYSKWGDVLTGSGGVEVYKRTHRLLQGVVVCGVFRMA